MCRVPPTQLSFHSKHTANASFREIPPPIFSLKILKIKKLGSFLLDTDGIPPSSLYAAFKRWDTVRWEELYPIVL